MGDESCEMKVEWLCTSDRQQGIALWMGHKSRDSFGEKTSGWWMGHRKYDGG